MNRDEKIYEDGITWLFGHHCLECGHLTFAQHDVKELAKYFYESGYHQAEKDLELGWEDVKLLIDIVDSENLKPHLFDEIDYQEVLKRFKENKGA